jgi:hypothetical protein
MCGRRTGRPPWRAPDPWLRRSWRNLQSDPSGDPSSGPASVTPRGHHRSPRDCEKAQVEGPEGSSVYWSDCIHGSRALHASHLCKQEVFLSSMWPFATMRLSPCSLG